MKTVLLALSTVPLTLLLVLETSMIYVLWQEMPLSAQKVAVEVVGGVGVMVGSWWISKRVAGWRRASLWNALFWLPFGGGFLALGFGLVDALILAKKALPLA